jgi:hypothetical protein
MERLKGSGQGVPGHRGGVAKSDRSLVAGISTLCTLSRYHSHLQHMNAIFRVSKWGAEHCSWCEGQYSGHGIKYWICRSSRRYRPRAARSPPTAGSTVCRAWQHRKVTSLLLKLGPACTPSPEEPVCGGRSRTQPDPSPLHLWSRPPELVDHHCDLPCFNPIEAVTRCWVSKSVAHIPRTPSPMSNLYFRHHRSENRTVFSAVASARRPA